MSTIKATVDGTEYSPVESILTGGKTVGLEAELDLENKNITITENGDTEIIPSAGKDGIGSVLIHTNVQGAGGIDALLYTSQTPVFSNRYPSENPVINAPYVTKFPSIFGVGFREVFPYKNIILKSNRATDLTKSCQSDRPLNESDPHLETLTLDMDLSSAQSYTYMIDYQYQFAELKGTPLDFTSVTNPSYSRWIMNSSGKNVVGGVKARYKANTVHVDHDLGTIKFTDDTMVSIANGLQSGAYTLTLHEDMKTKCQTIMGRVSQTADDTGTYDLFTADSSGAAGSVSLEHFITTTKGWTIA